MVNVNQRRSVSAYLGEVSVSSWKSPSRVGLVHQERNWCKGSKRARVIHEAGALPGLIIFDFDEEGEKLWKSRPLRWTAKKPENE